MDILARSSRYPNPSPVQQKYVPTPKDPLFPGFFVNYYTDDAPKVGMLHGVYKTYAVASGKAAELQPGSPRR